MARPFRWRPSVLRGFEFRVTDDEQRGWMVPFLWFSWGWWACRLVLPFGRRYRLVQRLSTAQLAADAKLLDTANHISFKPETGETLEYVPL